MTTLGESKVLSFYFCVNQGNKEGRRVQDFLVTAGVVELPLSLFASKVA